MPRSGGKSPKKSRAKPGSAKAPGALRKKKNSFSKKGGWKGFFKRMSIALGVIACLLLLFYWWQPLRIDIIQRKPDPPLTKIPLSDTGLLNKNSRVLIVTAHPDDEAYYIGGTLFALKKAGATVKLIALTNGDKSYYFFTDSSALTKTRKEELQASCKVTGVKEVEFFDEPDGRLGIRKEVVNKLAREIQSYRPTHILSFDPDYPPRISHGDHRNAGEMAKEAAGKFKYKGWLMLFSTYGANTALDGSKYWDDAQKLLGVHKSQFYGEKLVRIQNTVSSNAIEAGFDFDMGYAEPFRAIHMK